MMIKSGRLVQRAFETLTTILFLSWAYYQINDPDALYWVSIYAFAASAGILGFFNRLHAGYPLVIGLVSSIWAAYLSTQVVYGPPLITIEAWREMMGLLVIVLFMGILAWIHAEKRVAVHASRAG